MKKLWRFIVGVVVLAIIPTGVSGAATAKKPVAQYVLANTKAKCKAHYVKRTITVPKPERVKSHGKWKTEIVKVNAVGCVYVNPKVAEAAPVVVTSTAPVAVVAIPVSAPSDSGSSSPVIIPVTASVDPTYTQDALNPKKVTFDYSAGVTDGSLPNGTLNFTVFVHATVAASGGCTINVGSSVTSGQCTVTVPAFGQYDLLTSYSGGANVAATSGTETVDIEPPSPVSEIVVEQWGTTAPTNGPTSSINVTGSSAAVSVTDSNWEGATSTGLTDNLGDNCAATITGTTATCSMAVSGTPSSLTVNYSGGIDDVTTQTVSPFGVSQTQQVTSEWPAENVAISNPTVTSQIATVSWNGGWLKNGNSTVQTFNPGPNNPQVMTVGETLRMAAATTGSVLGDPYPIGYLVVSVSGPGGYFDVNEGGFGASDCSELANYSSQAVGTCQFSFSSSGIYTITYSYNSQDLTYGSGASISVVVNVT